MSHRTASDLQAVQPGLPIQWTLSLSLEHFPDAPAPAVVS